MTYRPGRAYLSHALIITLLLSAAPLAAEEQYWVYTVRPGDTIWDLTQRHTTSVLHWKRIQHLNNIPDGPDRSVPPGTRLRFPISLLKHQPASAEITSVQGEVSLLRNGAREAIAVTDGVTLHSGDRLRTGAASNLVIRFADGSELLVAADSDVLMDSLSAYGDTGMVDTRIRLQGGSVDTQVQPARGPGSRYEIITPAAIAAVRGTDFRVSAEADAAVSRNEVLEGKLKVSGGGAAQLVPGGFGLRSEAGVAPASPRPLLPAPQLDADNAVQQRLPLSFSWSGIEAAHGYRFQIAPDGNFRRLLADERTPGTRAFWKDLPDGDYVLRVRGIDAVGLEGLNAIQPFTLNARPEPPLPIGLINAAVVHEAQPTFSWSQPQDAQSYRLQLAQDAQFATPLVDIDGLRDTRFVPDSALPEGTYYWRLASISNGEQGPFSDAQEFSYRALPDSPALQAPGVSDEELAFRWASAGDGLRYHCQFARDADFTDVLHEQTTADTGLSLPRPPAQRYYFRVRAIDADGYASPFGTTQQIDVPPGSYWPLLIPLLILLV